MASIYSVIIVWPSYATCLDSLYPQGGVHLNVTAIDYDEITSHKRIIELLTVISLETHACMFQNYSEPKYLAHDGYLELNISYQLMASNSNACALSPCQSGEICQVTKVCGFSLTNVCSVFVICFMQCSGCLLKCNCIYTYTYT